MRKVIGRRARASKPAVKPLIVKASPAPVSPPAAMTAAATPALIPGARRKLTRELVASGRHLAPPLPGRTKLTREGLVSSPA